MGQNPGPSGGAEDGETVTTRMESGSNASQGASTMAIENRATTTDSPLNGFVTTDESATRGRKRKPPDGSVVLDRSQATSLQHGHSINKKARLVQDNVGQSVRSHLPTGIAAISDRSLLPPELWHHIFTFCPPKSLGVLLVVNRTFNRFLDPASSFRSEACRPAAPGVLRLMEPNAIWQASRRLFWPQMPAPIRSKTELDMWRLACSPRCSGCGRLPGRGSRSSSNPRHPGPGPEGVAAVWVFGRRMCIACLLKETHKELDLQISPSVPSAIMPALPFIFLTQECDIFSAAAFEQRILPAALEATTLFSKSDVEVLRQEFLQVKDMGQGTVGEWIKGLPSRGSDTQQEASKWEKWESSGGILKMRSLLYPGHEKKCPVSLPQKPLVNPRLVSPPSQGRHERTAEEAAELKAARRAEIERRSLLLDPPLSADVLCCIPSFQAATQIVARLDDDAWERLKPRLLAQRADAEKLLRSERKTEPEVKQEVGEQQHHETTLAAEKEARDRIDKTWEEVQAPLRAQIAGYADEVVTDSWAKGRKVTRENCAQFAVESLLYIRKRFYAAVAKEAAAAKAAGKTPAVDPPEGPFTQKLTLENMKWIFDTKLKPHIEPLRKELFYCNGCEGNNKSFGFEGVIQHYAAKHTGALSLGSIVVHWRAEWPEHPPFSATVRSAKAPRLPPASSFAVNGVATLPASYSYPPAGLPPPPPPYPASTGYGYTPPAYGDYLQPAPALPQPYQPQPIAPPLFAPQPGYEPQPPYALTPVPAAPYSAYMPAPMPYAAAAVEPAPGFMWRQGGQSDSQYGPFQGSLAGGPYAPPPPPAYPDLYQTKVEDIARNSREVWRLLGDIRDLPGNVRVFVTIHYLVKKFRFKFVETPPLTMFIDGLSNNKEMRPVRNVNGLVCKACHLGLGNAASVEQERRSYSLPQLANHFQSKHLEPMQRTLAASPPLDWVVDMVLVSDLAALPDLASSASEPQRALLSDPLPDAFKLPPTSFIDHSPPQQLKRQDEETLNGGRLSTAAGSRQGHATDNGHIGRPGDPQIVEASLSTDHRPSGQSSHRTTPGTVSTNDSSAYSAGGRRSLHARGPNRGRKESHNHHRTASRKNRVKPQSGQSFGNPPRTDGEKIKYELADGHATSVTSQAEMPPVQSLVPRVGERVNRTVSQGRAPPPLNAQPPQQRVRDSSRGSPKIEQERSITATLEAYLDQSQLPRFHSAQGAPDHETYADKRGSGNFSNPQSEERPYSRYDGRGGLVPSPLPFSTGRSHNGRDIGPVYHGDSRRVEIRDSAHSLHRTQAGYTEPPLQHAEEHRFGLPASRQDYPRQSTSHPETNYHQQDEGRRLHSSAPIEAYEIVHVIDEHGEYYIRRPVRRERDARSTYDERPVHNGSGTHSALDPAYASGRRLSAAHDHFHGRVATYERRGERPHELRVDPAYYEQYDPRFPAA